MKFPFLTKSAPLSKPMEKHRAAWTIDETKYLSESETKTLLETALSEMKEFENSKFNKIRNWFMIELGLNTGLRVSEMTSLKHEDLLLENGKSSLKVLGKGNKPRLVLISNRFKNTCLRYVGLKKNYGYPIENDSYLLINTLGNKITKRALQKAFKILIKKSGLPNHYHLHSLRHTYTTFLLRASKNNYRFAQLQLGHASIKTTQTYAGVLESEGKIALENMYN